MTVPRVLLTALVLSGCPHPAPTPTAAPQVVVVPQPGEPPVPPVCTTNLDSVLATAGWAVNMPAERQADEIERWTERVERDDLAADRLRLAMLLVLSEEPLRDDAQARELLTGRWLAGDTGSAEVLSRLLLELVHTRAEAASDQSRTARQLAALRAERDELAAKLEAMEAIEVEMEQRSNGGSDGADSGGR